MSRLIRVSGVVACLLGVVLGCHSPESPAGAEGEHQEHGHAHTHSHAAGPHGGHLVALGDKPYHAEWVHDDPSGAVTVYILDAQMKDEVPIPADRLTIDVGIGDAVTRYELTAMDRAPESNRSSRFGVVDPALIEALKLAGSGVKATLRVDIEGALLTAELDH